MKDKDTFFSQTNCDRCRGSLQGDSRQLSWFTEDCLCSKCVDAERELKRYLEDKGINTSDLEGCGYMPKRDN